MLGAGWAGDRYGARRVCVVGLGVFALGSACCRAGPGHRCAGRGPGAAGRGRGRAAAVLPDADRRSVPGPAGPGARAGRVGRHRCDRDGGRAGGRRCAGGLGGLAVDLPRQPADLCRGDRADLRVRRRDRPHDDGAAGSARPAPGHRRTGLCHRRLHRAGARPTRGRPGSACSARAWRWGRSSAGRRRARSRRCCRCRSFAPAGSTPRRRPGSCSTSASTACCCACRWCCRGRWDAARPAPAWRSCPWRWPWGSAPPRAAG